MKNVFNKKIFLSLLLFAGFLFVAINYARASEYDIYVDESYSGGSSDGSSSKPFNSIKDALEKADSGNKIYVKKGTYKEKIILSDKIKLYGAGSDSVISGGVTMKDGTLLENITIIGSSTGVLIEKDANVSIINCVVRNSGSTGIDVQEGDGKLILKNSKIYSNDKGLYIQRGNQIEISGSSIYGNKQEGIDLRAKVNGTIKNNSIYSNKEGGIEVIVGSSDLSISGNNIKSNSASGIAAQFYSENKKTGQIKITSNKITKNGKYGIACGTPSGGNPSKGYWAKSLELKDNTIDNNKGKAIAGSCKLIEAVEAEEEKDNAIIEDPNAKEMAEEVAKLKEEEARLAAQEAERKAKLEENKREIEIIKNESNSLIGEIEVELKKIEKRSKLKKIFFGANKDDINVVNSKITELDSSILKLETLQEKVEDQDIRSEISSKIEELKGQKNKFIETVDESNKQKGVFGWIKSLFD